MISKYFLRKGIVYKSKLVDDNGFDLSHWLKKSLNYLHIQFYDDCCDTENSQYFPIRFNEDGDVLERFDGTEWVVIATGSVIPPPPPTLLAPTNLIPTAGDTIASIAWTSSLHATGYEYQYATDNIFTIGLQSGNDTTSPTPLTGLTNGTPYFFRIRATALGYTTSAWSTTATFTPQAAPVTPQVFYGTKSSGTNLIQSQIEAGTAQAYTALADITVPYNTSSPIFHWAAWPDTEIGIDNYYINSLDFGIFDPGNTFAVPVHIGSYYFTITNYATQMASVDFKH